jgi:hypothetical protein
MTNSNKKQIKSKSPHQQVNPTYSNPNDILRELQLREATEAIRKSNKKMGIIDKIS